LVRSHSGFGSRVSKYQHRFFTAEYGALALSPQELAVMCELMLRGPQTPVSCAAAPSGWPGSPTWNRSSEP